MATEGKKDNAIVETIKTVVWALVIAGVFRTVFFQPFWIPSGSMKDTLLIGDFLFVNKMAYGYSYASCPSIRRLNIDAKGICGFMDGDNTRIMGSEPERGDVIVFRHPVTGQDYIKRLIGLPGDTVQLKDGLVYLNGVAAKIEEAGKFEEVYESQGGARNKPGCENGILGEGATCLKSRYMETFPGGEPHAILNIADIRTDNTAVFTVPAGQYFFMGDNRDNSLDSRVAQQAGGVGFVPYENLIGRADRIVFSFAGRSALAFWTWRSDRYFKAVN
ncbi:MAG: signal peptidase I [Thalassovita sp.]